MLHFETTSDELLNVLRSLMQIKELADFRLVGGTALSLLRGHRASEDIDLFCEGPYGEIHFNQILANIEYHFKYVEKINPFNPTDSTNNLGLYLFIGKNEVESIKTDILYWDAPFLFPPVEEENIRLATVEDIAAMKLDAISRGGRKKDFWDLSEILESHSISTLIEVYKKKYPWNSIEKIKEGLTNFSISDKMPDPICYKNKSWDKIKSEMILISGPLE